MKIFLDSFLHNNDPMCLSYDGIENTVQYMLLCQEYTAHRTVLLGKVAPICASFRVDCNTLDNEELLFLLLYGDDAFNESANKDLLSATILYINSTKRFI